MDAATAAVKLDSMFLKPSTVTPVSFCVALNETCETRENEGRCVGCLDGCCVGCVLGQSLGWPVGCTVGCPVGMHDGWPVGWLVLG